MTPRELVRDFIENVRSGKHPDWAGRYMAETVTAHQVWSEGPETVVRSPDDYRAHIEEFLEYFGPFEITIEELLADGDKVFVRWRQNGHHAKAHGDERATNAPMTELTSVVYRVEGEKIVEYWLQFDRKGMDLQIDRLARS